MKGRDNSSQCRIIVMVHVFFFIKADICSVLLVHSKIL